MKMAPIIEAMNRHPERLKHRLVHTGQHYDEKMSRSFFADLGMPRPDIDLGVGSGSHAEQTARVMVEFEKLCLAGKPDLVIVGTDPDRILAAARKAMDNGVPRGRVPEKWDGKAAQRIVDVLLRCNVDMAM